MKRLGKFYDSIIYRKGLYYNLYDSYGYIIVIIIIII